MSRASRSGFGHMGAEDMRDAHLNKTANARGKGHSQALVHDPSFALRSALVAAYRREEKRAEIAAQHGPVKQIVKDGKPVQEDSNG